MYMNAYLRESIALSLLAIACGGALLCVSAHYFVRAAVNLADALRIPHLIIGATVVAIATTLPEAIVSLLAHLVNHAPDITVGNVVGSNICNSGLIIGASATVMPILVARRTAMIQCVYMLVASCILWGAAFFGVIPQWLGLLLVCLCILYLLHAAYNARKFAVAADSIPTVVRVAPLVSLAIIAVSSTIMVGGSHLLIQGVKETAIHLHVPQLLISLTVVAVGTSLPELVTAITALVHKHSDLSVGNIIGANFLNISGAMGIAALLKPLPISPAAAHWDIPLMCLLAALLMFFLYTGSRLVRREGVALLLVFALFLVSVILRISA